MGLGLDLSASTSLRSAGRLALSLFLCATGLYLLVIGIRELSNRETTDGLILLVLAGIALRVATLEFVEAVRGEKPRTRALDAAGFLVALGLFGVLEVVEALQADDGRRAFLLGVAAVFVFSFLAYILWAWRRGRHGK